MEFVKIDAEANDLEKDSVRGYPTLKLFKMADKLNPVQYIGERKVSLMKDFLKQHIKIDTPKHEDL